MSQRLRNKCERSPRATSYCKKCRLRRLATHIICSFGVLQRDAQPGWNRIPPGAPTTSADLGGQGGTRRRWSAVRLRQHGLAV